LKLLVAVTGVIAAGLIIISIIVERFIEAPLYGFFLYLLLILGLLVAAEISAQTWFRKDVRRWAFYYEALDDWGKAVEQAGDGGPRLGPAPPAGEGGAGA
jgi:hypothetical protein